MRMRHRWISTVLAISVGYGGLLQGAQAALIGTDAVAAAQHLSSSSPRTHLAATLDRAEVAAALAKRGVDLGEARARVAALDDEQAAALLAEIDSAPAGGDGVLGTIVFIFVLLLVTDILGLTKVFPFTRSVR